MKQYKKNRSLSRLKGLSQREGMLIIKIKKPALWNAGRIQGALIVSMNVFSDKEPINEPAPMC
jgi:hypothetical protein